MIKDQLNAIIELLTEINNRLGAAPPVTDKPKAKRKLTAKQQLHANAVAEISQDRVKQKKKAERMFAGEIIELKKLENELERLK